MKPKSIQKTIVPPTRPSETEWKKEFTKPLRYFDSIVPLDAVSRLKDGIDEGAFAEDEKEDYSDYEDDIDSMHHRRTCGAH